MCSLAKKWILAIGVCLIFISSLSQANDKKIASSEDAIYDVHAAALKEKQFPSAQLCASCHPRQFRQWSVSQHAYAQLSPIFLAMQNTSIREQSGTLGDFCIRCHTPVGMTLKESMTSGVIGRHLTSREGVTCVVCHRQNQNRGKVSGRVHLIKGDLTKTIYGPRGGRELKRVLARPNEYKVVTKMSESGRHIHRRAKRFFALVTPKFCGTCHDVHLINGFRLEEALSEYRHSPAAKKGVTCQDCHMGKRPGKVSGYDYGPAATVGEVDTKPRRLSNHYFAGPDAPIIHPGVFPFNPQAGELATVKQWLRFNYRRGWGTDAFEHKVSDKMHFPKPWDNADARYDGREIIDEQLALLKWAQGERQKVLKAGYQLSQFEIMQADAGGIRFRIKVKNPMEGHNAPTGFIAERLVFLQVTVRDRWGSIIFRSGDRDKDGDVRDLHSEQVLNQQVDLDKQLFNLQSKFVIRNVRGGEREAVLPINRSFDPRPFVRPATQSTILTGNPANGRIHRKGIPPMTFRWAQYQIPREVIAKHPGPYRVDIKLIAQMVPVNLIKRIQKVGFDFGMSPKTVAHRVKRAAHIVAHKHYKINLYSLET